MEKYLLGIVILIVMFSNFNKNTSIITYSAPIIAKLEINFDKSKFIKDFVVKHNNKKIDFDSYYGFQCVDLANQFYFEFYGIKPIMANLGAKNIYRRNLFVKEGHNVTIINAYKDLIEGDITFYDNGVDGHVAIYIGNNQLLSQNNQGNARTPTAIIPDNFANLTASFIGAYRLNK